MSLSCNQEEILQERWGKSDDLTRCLSALLPEDKCAGETLERSSLPGRRRKERVDGKGALTSFII